MFNLLVDGDIGELMSLGRQVSRNGVAFEASFSKPLFIIPFAFTWMLVYVAFLG